MKAVSAITRRLIAGNKISLIITLAVVLCATSSGETVLSNGNYTWLLAFLSPFFFVYYDFSRLMHLGASKRDYFWGCIISYSVLASAISLVNTAIHYLLDPLYPAEVVINMMDVCRWTDNIFFVAALQQMFFLLLAEIFLHVLLSMQDRWYGWLADILLVGIICIFTPIASLRAVLSSFFHLVMLNGNALIQIALSVLLSVLLSSAGILILKRKTL